MKVLIEFENCELSINYIGTSEEIAMQKAIDSIEMLGKSIGETLREVFFSIIDHFYNALAVLMDAYSEAFAAVAKNIRSMGNLIPLEHIENESD